MTINHMIVGMLQTNCYIVTSDKKNAVVIDPGANADAILGFLKDEGVTLQKIFLTHGHFDHFGAAKKLIDSTDAKLYIHSEDQKLIEQPAKYGGNFNVAAAATKPVKDSLCLSGGDEIALDEVSFKVMHTPGHSEGSCVFICDDILFTGDTLFCGGCGRTDLYGGSADKLKASLASIAALTGDYTVLSGHGEQSTLNRERNTNPYLGTEYDDIF